LGIFLEIPPKFPNFEQFGRLVEKTFPLVYNEIFYEIGFKLNPYIRIELKSKN